MQYQVIGGMTAHHHKDLRVTSQEINVSKNWNRSQMSHHIRLLTKDRSSPQTYFQTIQDKQKMQVGQPVHLRVTNQEVSVFMCRKNSDL
jgi:hypothetical protein